MTRPDGTLATFLRLALIALVAIGFVLSTADPFTMLFFGAYVAVGLILAIRLPRNTVSWLLIGIAFGFLGTTSRPQVDAVALEAGRGSLTDLIVVWIGTWIAGALFLGFAVLAAVFPSGHLPTGRWRRAVIAVLALGVTVVALSTAQPILTVSPDGVTDIHVPNPAALLPDAPFWPIVSVATYLVVIIALAVGVASMLARYRSSDDQTKLQLRWLLAAMSAVLVGVVLALSVSGIRGDDVGGLVWIPVIVTYPLVPLAIGVAVLRYRLYEIDRIVNRALVYGFLTALLAGVYAAATALSQRLFVEVVGQSSDAAVVLTTLVVVAIYAPLRGRVEHIVDRYFRYEQREYGRYLDELSRHLDLVDPSRAAARLAHEAQIHTGAEGVAVLGSHGEIVGSAGTWPLEPVETVPIAAAGAPLGSILLGPRRDGRRYAPAHLRALADAAAVAVAALGGGR
jgi:hypothetical protein